MFDYRKIYEEQHGPIPIDEDGRTYEIHHIDGNHKNNDPKNLIAVSIKEHYDIHATQGDWGACASIAARMGKSTEEISELAKLFNESRVKAGTHNFLIPGFSKSVQIDRVRKGTHPFLKRADGSSVGGDANKKRIKDGTYVPPLTPDKAREVVKEQLKNGKHSSQVEWNCEVCGKKGRGAGNYTLYHGKNCLPNGKNNHPNNGRKKCTVDGITIFESRKELIKTLGWGRNGVRHPNFRYLS